MKQMEELGIKLTAIGNSSMVAQTTLNNLSRRTPMAASRSAA